MSIGSLAVRVPHPGTGVIICYPVDTGTVTADFTASGTFYDPDTIVYGCLFLHPDGAIWAPAVCTGNEWEASFSGVGSTGGNFYPLHAIGNVNFASVDVRVDITGSGGGGGGVCIALSYPLADLRSAPSYPSKLSGKRKPLTWPEIERRDDMLRWFAVKRVTHINGTPISLGTPVARVSVPEKQLDDFRAAGQVTSPDKVIECKVGGLDADEITNNKTGPWKALFHGISPGTPNLSIGTAKAKTDAVTIEVVSCN